MSEEDPKPKLLPTLAGNLWFPLLFFFGFIVCYMMPFHSPAPHDVRVAVSGPTAAQLGQALEKQAPGAFEIVPYEHAGDAKQAVLDRDTAAAFTPQGDTATLHVTKANGAMLEQTLTTTFSGVAAQSDQHFTSHEIVSIEKGDVTGTAMFYVAMVWNIVPYITVMMLLRAVTLSRRTKMIIFAGVGAFISVAGYLAGLAMDIIPNDPLAILYAFLITQAVSWVTFGLVPFVKQYIPGVAITLFVLLSIPSSGGAVPQEMVPGFFRWLHPVMPLGNLIDALHGIFYFDGKGLLRPTLVLCAWAVLGAALIGLSIVMARRKQQKLGTEAEAGPETVEEPTEDPSIEAPMPHAVSAVGHSRSGAPTLAGRVTQDGGAPVVHATVVVLDSRGRQLVRTRTDRDGQYAVTGLPEDFLTVLLQASGNRSMVTRLLPVAGRASTQDFVLKGSNRAEKLPAHN
ncbi:carboxypeptidase regulatory-like domain-containing protein [Streptomyces sp. NPDC005349]|uniref:carboxypeptidase regulatory-like domain-containing protein n=1 Tax=Streptomyces sp. NPDC005349 TaxID=3157037 RepID=UPI00339FF8F2